MATATLAPTSVDVVSTEDGMLVRLAGELAAESAGQLRHLLLRLRPAGVDDVVVDAADVTAVDDTTLAVLLAASCWVADTGGRFSFSRMSEPLRREVAQLGVEDELGMLEPVGDRATALPMPPRSAFGG